MITNVLPRFLMKHSVDLLVQCFCEPFIEKQTSVTKVSVNTSLKIVNPLLKTALTHGRQRLPLTNQQGSC